MSRRETLLAATAQQPDCEMGAHKRRPLRPVPENALYAPLPETEAVSGLSRSTLYRLAGEGRIRLVKSGRTTLADLASVRRHLASLPAAEIRTGREVEEAAA